MKKTLTTRRADAAFAAEFLPEVFIPYYLALVTSGTTHLTLGLSRAAAILGLFEVDQDALLPLLAVLNLVSVAATLKLCMKYPMQSKMSVDLTIKANKEVYPAWLFDYLVVRWRRKNGEPEGFH